MVKKTFQGVLEHDLVSYANFNIFYTKLLQNNNLTGPFLSRKFNIQPIQLFYNYLLSAVFQKIFQHWIYHICWTKFHLFFINPTKTNIRIHKRLKSKMYVFQFSWFTMFSTLTLMFKKNSSYFWNIIFNRTSPHSWFDSIDMCFIDLYIRVISLRQAKWFLFHASATIRLLSRICRYLDRMYQLYLV